MYDPRKMMWGSSLAVGLLLTATGYAPGDGNPAVQRKPQPWERVEQLITQGKCEAALSLIEKSQKEVLADANRRLTAWTIDFMGSEVDHALVGRAHIYFTYHAPNSSPDAPGMKSTLGLVEPSEHSDWRHVAVCADARTGRILWSRPYGGLCRPAVDPATDTLYLIGSDAIVGLSPDGAEPTVFPLLQKERVVGLMTKSGFRASGPQGLCGDWNRDPVYVYATGTRSLVAMHPRELATLSPDESRRLVLSTDNGYGFNNKLICQTMGGKELWSFQVPGRVSCCIPQFYKGGVLCMSGSTVQKSQVIRLDAETGKVSWATVLPNGAYTPSNHQLTGVGHPWDDWDPLGPLDDGQGLLAIDGTGRLFFLDGATGAILRTVRVTDTHLCAPTRVGELMVFCSFKAAFAVPVPTLMTSADDRLDERHILVSKARCLAGLGRLDGAMSLLDHVLAYDEDCAQAWRARADVCTLQGDQLDSSFSLCRYAQVAGLQELPELRESCGLLRLIALGSRPTPQMLDLGEGEVYLGTLRGDLWGVSPDTLQAHVLARREQEINGLSREVRISFLATGGWVGDTEWRPKPDEPADAPVEWFTLTGYDGPPVFFGGKYYRALGGGRVRIWDGHNLVERGPLLKGITQWKIHVSASGPLGYGPGGVYALDGDLCPKSLLFDPYPPGPANVEFICSVGDSLGMVVTGGGHSYLQVFGAADHRLRSQVSLGGFLSSTGYLHQFLVLGDGYLFSDRQLTWVSGRVDGGVWQFGPPTSRTEGSRWGDRWRYFNRPIIRDGRLLVSACDGLLYVFDTARILNSRPTAPRDETHQPGRRP